MAARKKAKEEPWWPGEDSDKVLVPKVGQEIEFAKSLEEINQIANGKLGWDGHAEMFVDLNADVELKFRTSYSRKARIKKAKKMLQEAFCSNLVKYGEWLTPEQAEQRSKAITALYGKADKEPL